MYCPKCGQQQIADTTRFCSRCGLPIHGLPEWLERGGVSVVNEAAGPQARSPKQVWVRRGAKVMFFSAVLFPIFLALSIVFDSPGPLFVPATVFLAGLAMTLYTLIFSDDVSRPQNLPTRASELRSAFGKTALGPGTNNWAATANARQASTSELAQPASVTENTTKLLVDE